MVYNEFLKNRLSLINLIQAGYGPCRGIPVVIHIYHKVSDIIFQPFLQNHLNRHIYKFEINLLLLRKQN